MTAPPPLQFANHTSDDRVALHDATRVRALDGLRGVAVGLVLLTHCFRPVATGSALINGLNHLLGSFWLGVDLFFVLSGYLITRVLLAARERPHYFRNFYMRRVVRIWPAYYLVLAYVVLLVPLIEGTPWDRMQQPLLPWLLLQVQNWAIVLHAQAFPWDWNITHFWSLGVEEQFYFVWPLLVLKLPRERLLPLCAWLFVLSLLARLALIAAHATWMTFYVMPLSHMDGLVAGAALAALLAQPAPMHVTHRTRMLVAERFGWIALLALLLIGHGIDGDPPWVMALAISAATLAFTGLLFRIHDARLPAMLARTLNSGALVWLGRYSYGIYLIHFVLLSQVTRVIAPHLPASIALHANLRVMVIGVIVTALSLLWARLMFHWVEAPALRWGGRYRSKAIVSA